MRELAVRRRVVSDLRAAGAWVRGIHGGAYTAGLPDLVAIRDGRTVWIEVKAPGGRPTKLQEAIHRDMRAHGATVLVGSDAKILCAGAVAAFERGRQHGE